MEKKLISVVVPVYNEEAMLDEVAERTSAVMQTLSAYDYEIVFFDDGSTDGSREKIEALCAKDAHIKAVFYSRNFGYSKSIYYMAREARGDAVVLLHCDLQNPPEEIPRLVEKWEKGHDVVLGVKNKSRENKLMYFFRTLYYFFLRAFFGVKLIPHATEFELFDRSFTDVLRRSEYRNPFLRGIVLEYAKNIACVYYTQDKRKKGKSRFNLSRYYDFIVCGIVNASVKLPRRMLVFCGICFVLSLAELIFNYIPDYVHGILNYLTTGLLVRITFMFVILLAAFISIMFEFIISLYDTSNKKPLVVEEKRIDY